MFQWRNWTLTSSILLFKCSYGFSSDFVNEYLCLYSHHYILVEIHSFLSPTWAFERSFAKRILRTVPDADYISSCCHAKSTTCSLHKIRNILLEKGKNELHYYDLRICCYIAVLHKCTCTKECVFFLCCLSKTKFHFTRKPISFPNI